MVRSQNCIESLLDLIHITEYLSAKIHGIKTQEEIFNTIEKEFRESKKYTCSIVLLNEEKTGLRIMRCSQLSKLIHAAEKTCKIKIKEYTLDLKKSRIYNNVICNGETVHVSVSDVIMEMFQKPASSVINKIFGFAKKMSVITPLKKNGACIGALAMSSMGIGDKLIPSVRYFSESISVALELADETHERTMAQKSLKESEELLRIERKALEEKNIAMKEILRQIESEKKNTERQFAHNVEKIILPVVERLKKKATSIEVEYLELIEKNLRELASPFLTALSANYSNLTPREVEVCNMIKNGLSSKEIANLLSISTQTVHRYREFIRRKLGITNKDISMQTFLNSGERY